MSRAQEVERAARAYLAAEASTPDTIKEYRLACDRAKNVLQQALALPAGGEVKLETTAEERARWRDMLERPLDTISRLKYLQRPEALKLLRDIDTLLSASPSQGERKIEPTWRCFHCDEVFTDVEAARLHFGSDETRQPACQIDVAHVREMESQLNRYHAEDSDKDREFYALNAAHSVALIREEEKGYERGLRDGRTFDQRIAEQRMVERGDHLKEKP